MSANLASGGPPLPDPPPPPAPPATAPGGGAGLLLPDSDGAGPTTPGAPGRSEVGSPHPPPTCGEGGPAAASVASPRPPPRVVAKFLLSNAAAGSIIGRSGQTINELQAASGARLQLSRAGEFFPGTADRVLLVAGPLDASLAALHLILTKLQAEQAAAGDASLLARDGASLHLRMLVPASLCGAIIGRGGATIRAFAEDARAAIAVSPPDSAPPGIADRVVRVVGAPGPCLRAVALLLARLAEAPHYARFTNSSVSYAAGVHAVAGVAAAAAAAAAAATAGGAAVDVPGAVDVGSPPVTAALAAASLKEVEGEATSVKLVAEPASAPEPAPAAASPATPAGKASGGGPSTSPPTSAAGGGGGGSTAATTPQPDSPPQRPEEALVTASSAGLASASSTFTDGGGAAERSGSEEARGGGGGGDRQGGSAPPPPPPVKVVISAGGEVVLVVQGGGDASA